MIEFLNVLMRSDVVRARAGQSARQGSDVQDSGGARERNAVWGERKCAASGWSLISVETSEIGRVTAGAVAVCAPVSSARIAQVAQ
jgi:hypothetical protein